MVRRPARRERAPLRHPRRGRRADWFQVAPLVESGLHCGVLAEHCGDGLGGVAPLVESGLHCGDQLGDSWELALRVAPLVESGLHCGLTIALAVALLAGRPARRERAPLRPRPGGLLGVPPLESPRSSRAGSIAAHRWTTSSPASPGSPRSSRAGSIAAPCTGLGIWRSSGRPARRERAPLRHLLRRVGGLRRGHVAPLVESGLHCGLALEVSATTGNAGRPARRERAPLRPVLGTPQVRAAASRPARRERAPLRLLPQRHARPGPGVAPLVESGLHCGGYQESGGALLTASPRSSRAGSIAALRRAPGRRRSYRVAPLVESGLHCGGKDAGTAEAAGMSPRSSRAGSIAAARTPAPPRRPACRPARRERAPLRRQGRRHRRGGPLVAPLVESGLHCGGAAAQPAGLRQPVSPRSSRAGSIAATLRKSRNC